MLYLTTRNKIESVTAYYTMTHDRSSDGGYFVPMQIPVISADALAELSKLSFNDCVADILGRFFPKHLCGWNIDFSVGKNPVRLKQINQKIFVAEAWHNPEGDFSRMVENLASMISKDICDGTATSWMWTAARIAVLFAEFAQLRSRNVLLQDETFDISVSCANFDIPFACWYARRMGLPIGKIICSCLQNSQLWDFRRTGNLQSSHLLADGFEGFERLIYSALGKQEAFRYIDCCKQKRNYVLNDLYLQRLFDGIRVSVISSHRIAPIINGTFTSADFLMDPFTALAYAGSQDIRATEGENGITLLISEKSPSHFADVLAKTVKVPIEEINSRF